MRWECKWAVVFWGLVGCGGADGTVAGGTSTATEASGSTTIETGLSEDSEAGSSESGSTPTSTLSDTTGPDATGPETASSTETGGPACGDGQLDRGEACDDGNDINADGCNADCVASGSELWTIVLPEPALRVAAAGDEIVFARAENSDLRIVHLDANGNGVRNDDYTSNEGGGGAALAQIAVGPDGHTVVSGGFPLPGFLDFEGLVYRCDTPCDAPQVLQTPDVGLAAYDLDDDMIVGVTRTNAGDMFLRRYDADNLLVSEVELAEDVVLGGVRLASDGELWVAATTPDFPGAEATLRRYDTDGTLTWSEHRAVDTTGFALRRRPTGGVAWVGSTIAVVADGFADAYDATGDLVWGQDYPIVDKTVSAAARDVAIDSVGHTTICGGFGLIKYDADGEELWSQAIGDCLALAAGVDDVLIASYVFVDNDDNAPPENRLSLLAP